MFGDMFNRNPKSIGSGYIEFCSYQDARIVLNELLALAGTQLCGGVCNQLIYEICGLDIKGSVALGYTTEDIINAKLNKTTLGWAIDFNKRSEVLPNDTIIANIDYMKGDKHAIRF